MNDAPPMLSFSLLADTPSASMGWLPAIYGALGSAFVAALGYVLNRQGKRQENNDLQKQKGREEATAADLTLAGLNLATLKEAREQWRKDIHDERIRYQAELNTLTETLEALREDNENLKATHVEMYMAIRSNQEFFDMLKGRAKDGLITFRVDELPAHIDLSALSPGNVFRRRPKAQTQQISLQVLPPAKQ